MSGAGAARPVRDELAALIAAKLDGDRPEGWFASPCEQDEELADAILADFDITRKVS